MTAGGQLGFALVNFYALPLYLVHGLGISGLALGATSATFLLCEMALKFPLGRLSDRLGRRWFVALGPLLVCLNPVIITWLPPRLWKLVFPVRIVDGVGAAALWPPLYAWVGDIVGSRSRAAAMSVINTVYVGAVGAAAVLGAFIGYATGSPHFAFYLAALVLAASGLLCLFGLRISTLPANPADPLTAGHPDQAARPTTPHTTLYPIPLVLLISLLMSLGVLVLPNFLVLYLLGKPLNLSQLQLGLLLIVLGAPVLVLGLPLGHAADRLGKTRAIRVSLAVSALTMWLVPACHTVPVFAALTVLLVTSHILGTPAWLAIVSELAPTSRRGGVMGLVATAEGAGAALGPLLGGWLWDIRHEYIFYGSAALLSLAALAAAITLRGGPRPQEH